MIPIITSMKEAEYVTPTYLVQVGRNKSKYKTKYSFISWNKAVMYYRGINVGNGYKKRLVKKYHGKTEIVVRQFS